MTYIRENPPGSKPTASRSLYSRLPPFSLLQVPSSQKKQKNQIICILLGALLFGCIVSSVVRNYCVSVPTEGTTFSPTFSAVFGNSLYYSRFPPRSPVLPHSTHQRRLSVFSPDGPHLMTSGLSLTQ